MNNMLGNTIGRALLRRWIPLVSFLGFFPVLLPTAALGCGPTPEGGCQECGPHTNAWTLDYCPSQTNSASVSPGSYCQAYGTAPTVPTVVPPAYQAGQKETHTDYDCQSTVYQYAGISYSVGSVQWDPPLPGALTSAFSSTAYVNVTSSDPALCPSPGRVNIGSCSWGYYSCDNPHSLSATIYECLHYVSDPLGTACSTTQVIKDVLDTMTCDTHAGGTCAGICNLTDNTNNVPEIVQTVIQASCPGGTVAYSTWKTVYAGCTDCSSTPWQVSCTTGTPSGPQVAGPYPRGLKKVSCH